MPHHRGGLTVIESFFKNRELRLRGKPFVEGEIYTGEGGMMFLYFDKFSLQTESQETGSGITSSLMRVFLILKAIKG